MKSTKKDQSTKARKRKPIAKDTPNTPITSRPLLSNNPAYAHQKSLTKMHKPQKYDFSEYIRTEDKQASDERIEDALEALERARQGISSYEPFKGRKSYINGVWAGDVWSKGYYSAIKKASELSKSGWMVETGEGALTAEQANQKAEEAKRRGWEAQIIPIADLGSGVDSFVAVRQPPTDPKTKAKKMKPAKNKKTKLVTSAKPSVKKAGNASG